MIMTQFGSFLLSMISNVGGNNVARNNTEINNSNAQNSFVAVDVQDNLELQNERIKCSDALIKEQLDEKDEKLKKLLKEIDKNWFKKTVLQKEVADVKDSIVQAQEVIKEIRDKLNENDLQKKLDKLELTISKIEDISSTNDYSISSHETLSGAFDVLSVIAISVWTYFDSKGKIDESMPGNNLIPLALNITPNALKILILLKIKINKIQIEDKKDLNSIYKSLIFNLKDFSKDLYEKIAENKIRMAESRLFLRLREDRRSQEVTNHCFHPLLFG